MRTKVHPTDDSILNLLSNIEGVIGDYVNNYPGKNRADQNPRWLEDWFVARSNYFLQHHEQLEISSTDLDGALADIVKKQVSVVKRPATIVSLWPHYFRGFRNPPDPINLSGRLVVIDGQNSSGKTSLAESFEWLLTGQLVRRCFSDLGDAEELESCIGNQLRPEDEATWVEAQFFTSSGEPIKIKRVLVRDYGKEKSSMAESEFFINDKPLNRQEEENFLNELIAGIPPVLMQHSLRTFVLSTPRDRREYFECLLRLDEIAELIEKTVIGDARLDEFPSSLGSLAWKAWEDLKDKVTPEVRKKIKRIEQSPRESLTPDIKTALTNIAHESFGITTDAMFSIDEVKREIESVQQQKRAKSFPLLENLRPKKVIDPQLLDLFAEKSTEQYFSDLEKRHQELLKANQVAGQVGAAQLLVSQALEQLSKIGVITEGTENQPCPLCEYDTPTLSQQRINEIRSWGPIRNALQAAQGEYSLIVGNLKTRLDGLITARMGLIPDVPDENDWTDALKSTSDLIKEAASSCLLALKDCIEKIHNFDNASQDINTALSGEAPLEDIEKVRKYATTLNASLGIVIDRARDYQVSFTALEKIVGQEAREDSEYNFREVWLLLVNNVEGLASDILWEQSKRNAKDELERIRKFLLATRDKIIESRRNAFSDGMTSIWGKLRSDRYSAFNRLFIPPAKGRGLPLEIQVKAILDDGTQQKEVDALRVFSESQINILGIAAFSTRSKMLGHRLIILDDPVQSMDEEHFKTFVNQLLPELLGEDGQVIILTHNDMFARELSYSWADKDVDFYITMSIEHRRKQGCVVEEGNRRVHERLEQAEKFAENGDLEKAWIAVRRSLERFYTLIRIKYGDPGFDHFSWRNSTGEDMWNQGVGCILENKGADTKRLKDILVMTAAAAHDKKPCGKTDLFNSTQYIRGLAQNLKVAG